jgi:mannose-1-phosphate guanylyltransferase
MRGSEEMKIVLLSGGSGQRLWPMSNESRSKQFLKILPNEKNGPISMLQRVWRQLISTGLVDHSYVCASKSQQDMIFHQIGEIPFIEEPFRKDTFPAICLSVLYLLDKASVKPDEPIAVIPVDHYVDNHYFEQVAQLGNILDASSAELVLMGVLPEAPTSKFGYISVEPSESSAAYRKVNRFVEKPEQGIAKRLIREGALWNCGVFCFYGQTILDFLQNQGYPASYEVFRREFGNLPKRSFDYEVVEKAKSVVVYPYKGAWKDIGTWSSLCAHMDNDIAGIGTSYDCDDTHVINELGIPVVALGLQNAIVVATPDGILAADKEHSSQLKNAVAKYHGRPMFEERRWGTYRVLDYQKLEDGTEVLTKCIELFSENNISYQKHFKRSEIWTIIEGTGYMALDDRIFPVSAGDVIRVYAEQWHAIRASTKLKFIEVQRGSELVEEDIVRRYLTWAEVESVCSYGVNH